MLTKLYLSGFAAAVFQALHSMSEFTEAKAMYKRAEAQESGNRDIREALIKLEQ